MPDNNQQKEIFPAFPPHPLTGLLFLNQAKEISPATSFALANCMSRWRDILLFLN